MILLNNILHNMICKELVCLIDSVEDIRGELRSFEQMVKDGDIEEHILEFMNLEFNSWPVGHKKGIK